MSSMRSMRPAKMTGFTLIDLLISVAIVAVLVAVALPSYTSYVAKAKRTEAKTQLVLASNFMMMFSSANDSYLHDRANNTVISQIPASLARSPATGTKSYTLQIPLGSAPLTNDMSFTLYMVPSDSMASDQCGTLTLTSTGVQGVIVNGVADTGSLRDTCWR